MTFRFSRPALGLVLGCCLGLAGGFAGSAQDTPTPDTTTIDDATDDATAHAGVTEPSPEQILAGKRVWIDAACFNCHGMNGQGGNSKDYPRGPSLRASLLDNEMMLEIIACGLPGTQMPAWAIGAYTERPCFGETGPIPDGLRVVPVYDDQQLADLIAYINAEFRKNSQ